MIEFCNKKRMVISVAFLTGLSAFVIFVENSWTPDSEIRQLHKQNLGENLTKPEDCWMVEKFTILDECEPCADIESKALNISACKTAKYKQKIKCEKTGEVYRKCDRVVWLEERHFLLFEILMFVLGISSGTFTFYRQRMLDNRVLKKIQKQVAAGV